MYDSDTARIGRFCFSGLVLVEFSIRPIGLKINLLDFWSLEIEDICES